MTNKQLDQYCIPLVGTELISVEKRGYSWFVQFGFGITIAAETLWRLRFDDRIVVTSEDDGHQFGLPEPVDATSTQLSTVRGSIVTASAIAPSSGDLTVDFGERTQLQFLQTSAGYESWRLSVPRSETICAGAGKIVRWDAPFAAFAGSG